MLEKSEPRLGLTRPEDLPVDDQRISEQVRPHEWPAYRMSFWERVRGAWNLVTKPDPEHERLAMEKVEQKHDWVSSTIGTIAGLLLIVAEQDVLPDSWKTYITAAALAALGWTTNSWKRLVEFVPDLIRVVIRDVTASKKADPKEPVR